MEETPQTVQYFLSNQRLDVINDFIEYMRERHCLENFYFFRDLQQFKSLCYSARQMRDKIVSEYIDRNAKYSINIDSDVQATIESTLLLDEEIFDRAESQIDAMLSNDVLPKYLSSERYSKMEFKVEESDPVDDYSDQVYHERKLFRKGSSSKNLSQSTLNDDSNLIPMTIHCGSTQIRCTPSHTTTCRDFIKSLEHYYKKYNNKRLPKNQRSNPLGIWIETGGKWMKEEKMMKEYEDLIRSKPDASGKKRSYTFELKRKQN